MATITHNIEPKNADASVVNPRRATSLVAKGVLLVAICVSLIIFGSTSIASASTTTNWYTQAGSPYTSVGAKCATAQNTARWGSGDGTFGQAIIGVSVNRTIALQYSQQFAFRVWIQDGAGAWHMGAWNVKTIDAYSMNGNGSETWWVGKVGPRLTSGWYAGSTRAHAAVETAVKTNGVWYQRGLNITSYAQDGGPIAEFPDCYI